MTTLQPNATPDAPPHPSSPPVGEDMAAIRAAQVRWAATPVHRRLAVVRSLRHRLSAEAVSVAACTVRPGMRSTAEGVMSEVLPVCDACRFLERRARSILRPRGHGWRGRPLWLLGSRLTVERVALGVVLVIAPSNYPLMLAAVPALQALAAGNAVILKPAPHGEAAAQRLAELLDRAGLPANLLTVTDTSVETAARAMGGGVDMVVLTGSHGTGRAVARQAAANCTPTIMELSGCDAAIVRADAPVELTVDALVYGLRLNASATCIAPRRVYVDRGLHDVLLRRLAERAEALGPAPVDEAAGRRAAGLVEAALAAGARCLTAPPSADAARWAPVVLADVPPDAELLREDVFAPVVSVMATDDDAEAIDAVNGCPYRLGATVFTADTAGSESIAERLDVGCVVINDMIAPTADPRVPFGGAGRSGHGVTRGAEGLLALTRPRCVMRRGGRSRPHFKPLDAAHADLAGAAVQVLHGRGLAARLRRGLRLARQRNPHAGADSHDQRT